uniref:Uncharacterized protein n=1 Tax=Timema monikensis TaxID=170555 RepID=A0A7R9EBW9_9NEOP|nr:unnamed protein product [Timema monikensis]
MWPPNASKGFDSNTQDGYENRSAPHCDNFRWKWWKEWRHPLLLLYVLYLYPPPVPPNSSRGVQIGRGDFGWRLSEYAAQLRIILLQRYWFILRQFSHNSLVVFHDDRNSASLLPHLRELLPSRPFFIICK